MFDTISYKGENEIIPNLQISKSWSYPQFFQLGVFATFYASLIKIPMFG
jgi:hypothetical protein